MKDIRQLLQWAIEQDKRRRENRQQRRNRTKGKIEFKIVKKASELKNNEYLSNQNIYFGDSEIK